MWEWRYSCTHFSPGHLMVIVIFKLCPFYSTRYPLFAEALVNRTHICTCRRSNHGFLVAQPTAQYLSLLLPSTVQNVKYYLHVKGTVLVVSSQMFVSTVSQYLDIKDAVPPRYVMDVIFPNQSSE